MKSIMLCLQTSARAGHHTRPPAWLVGGPDRAGSTQCRIQHQSSVPQPLQHFALQLCRKQTGVTVLCSAMPARHIPCNPHALQYQHNQLKCAISVMTQTAANFKFLRWLYYKHPACCLAVKTRICSNIMAADRCQSAPKALQLQPAGGSFDTSAAKDPKTATSLTYQPPTPLLHTHPPPPPLQSTCPFLHERLAASKQV